ncbi:hypothetical protein CH373_07925 [Leptospira perolatii]|uniref:Uncharacterized protein n=1 Tax=Leptospira perolatii TaxID=2023191 RepID=A0A2M9ZN84_9LEPT|nr:hypothetical protein CH360_13790 [Leptospira perolatii]PJZ73439.1 hypothetical protein CH373_07925 [Leptospira perolatii]
MGKSKSLLPRLKSKKIGESFRSRDSPHPIPCRPAGKRSYFYHFGSLGIPEFSCKNFPNL